ncbi:MAG: TonB family protein, partial [Elusimicrobia bacterium]|nr:TonB family protein [Elusimicrobiota bacterium]MBD3411843.1 TonB family protein [Elusimicrobiota bacterium]
TTSITLEGAKFPYLYYLRMIKKKIGQNWEWPQNQGVLKTIVYFKILRTGAVEGIEIDTSSKNSLFDTAALRAVHLAKPFSPLPGGYDEEYLGVYFEFAFKE